MIPFHTSTKLLLLAPLLAVAGTTSSWAQSFEDIRLEREARLAVFLNVNVYTSNSTLDDGFEVDEFNALFIDTLADHVVDFPMLNNVSVAESLPIREYVRKYKSLFRTRGMPLVVKHMQYNRTSGFLEIRAFVTKTFDGETTKNEWKCLMRKFGQTQNFAIR